jgi:cyclophilin family peptidyl-prolyl cis-trans isomerase
MDKMHEDGFMMSERSFRRSRAKRENRRSFRCKDLLHHPFFETLESRQLLDAVGFNSINDVTLSAGTALYVPLNSADPGNTVNYAVTASDYSKLTTVMMPQSNKSVQMNVNVNSSDQPMTFQLFDNLAPNTAAHIESLVQAGFYNGLQIYRNQAIFVIQGRNYPPTGQIKTDTSGRIAEEFDPNLQYNGAGILAMARSAKPGTGGTEFFVTLGDTRSLDYNYTVLGVQTTGVSTRDAITAQPCENSSGYGYLINPLTISSATIFTDTQNGLLQLRAPKGVTGNVTVTVVADDGVNAPTTQSFNVTIVSDSFYNPPNPFAAVIPAAPTDLSYLPPSGASNQFTKLNNSYGNQTLHFQVAGVSSGNVVEVLADGNPIGYATATGSTATVTTDGVTTLTEGHHVFTAIQIAPDQTVNVIENGSSTPLYKTADVPSLNSLAVGLTVDVTPPEFNFTPVTTAELGVLYTCQVTTTDLLASGTTFQLTRAPTGMMIDSATGLISWTPASDQEGNNQVTVQANDLAGNTVSRSFTIAIFDSPPVITTVSPSLSGGTLPTGTTTLTITFSEEVFGAENAANYRLQNVGLDGLLGTDDDAIVPLTVSYENSTAKVQCPPLTENVNRLSIFDAIADISGMNLDGNGDGIPGGNWRNDFVVNFTTLFSGPTSIPAGGSAFDGPIDVATADFNNDGRSDVAVINSDDHLYRCRILLTNNDGGFGSPFLIEGIIASVSNVSTGDFNNDGEMDLVLSRHAFPGVALLLGNGSGRFAPPTFFFTHGDITDGGAYGMTNGDFNGDGNLDLAVTNNDYYGAVSILLGDGKGGFAPATIYRTSDMCAKEVVSADINGDGILDLLVLHDHFDGSIAELLGDGRGGFALAANYDPNPGFFSPKDLAVGDFNDDGKMDLVVLCDSNIVSISLGNGQNGFGPIAYYGEGGYRSDHLALGDFNSDGEMDIALTIGAKPSVEILLGNGIGGFAPTIEHSTGTASICLAVGDFNGDDKPDLVVTKAFDNYDNSVDILLNICPLDSGILNPPKVLNSVNGLEFDVSLGSFGTGELIQGTSNAFDGMNRLQVDGNNFTLTSGAIDYIDDGQTVVMPPQSLAGLTVSRKISVPSTGNQDFAQTIDVFQNNTDSDISTNVSVVGNLGSDAATTVFATSDGTSIVSPNDLWFGTDDGEDGGGTPAIIHYIHGPGALQPDSVDVIGDNVRWTYPLTGRAGQTVRLGYFTIVAPPRAEAVAAANALVTPFGFGGQAAAYLDSSELQSLVNFVNTNQAPILLAGFPSLGTLNPNAPMTVNLSAFINNGPATTTITDADPEAIAGGIAMVGFTGLGEWSYSLDGTVFNPTGTISEDSALLLPDATWIRYTPALLDGPSASITYCAWDHTYGTPGTKATTTINGGATAFSMARDTASLILDNSPPTVTINQAESQEDPTSANNPPFSLLSGIHFTVVFSEPVNDFTAEDVTLGGTAPGTLSARLHPFYNSLDRRTYEVLVSGMTGSGTVVARIAKGVAHDAAGNPNEASTSTDNSVTYIVPTQTILGSAGNDVFEFISGGALGDWQLKENGLLVGFFVKPEKIIIDGGGGTDRVIVTGSNERDTFEWWSDHAGFQDSQIQLETVNCEIHQLDGNGGSDSVVIHDTAESDLFQAGPRWASRNGDRLPISNVENFRFVSSAGGNDRAIFYDSPGVDSLVAAPTRVELTMLIDGCVNTAENFKNVQVYATPGGEDMAYFTGSGADDEFGVSWLGAVMKNHAYDNSAWNFPHVQGVGGGGAADTARFWLPGDTADAFAAWPRQGSASSAAFDVRATDFYSIQCYGNKLGTAELHGSSGDDHFVAGALGATVQGADFDNSAWTINRINLRGTPGGNDRADFYGTPGKDTFRAILDGACEACLTQLMSVKIGPFELPLHNGPQRRSWDIPNVRVHAGGGYDTLELSGTPGNDCFDASGNWQRMTSPAAIDRVFEGWDFESVRVNGTSGKNQKRVTSPITPDISFEGVWSDF